MKLTLKRGFFAALFVIGILAVGRVALSFAFVAASVSQNLTMNGDPVSLSRLISTASGGFTSLGRTLSPGQHRTISVLDVPAEIEARRKAQDIQPSRGGPLILRIGD